jgi:hypothetical protein
MRTAEEIVKAINDFWKFDDNQQPMSSWHDKQDLIAFIESKFEKSSPGSAYDPNAYNGGRKARAIKTKITGSNPYDTNSVKISRS